MSKRNSEDILIGREREIAQLKGAFASPRSEFVTVYGRRRIGKTFLVNETFKDKFIFKYTGVYNIPNRQQLAEFHTQLVSYGLESESPMPKNWFDAFHLLEKLVDNSDSKRKVIFIDEMPWMDARNSRFIPALEHFWNGWASSRKDLMLIICGSASSWIIKKLFKNRGGLHNRVTVKIPLRQFSLHECEMLVRHLRVPASRKMIMEGYMVLGGIPYYWTKLDPQKSIPQNINDLFFGEDAVFRNEFGYIYSSMFNTPEKYIKIIEALSGKKSGLTREEIIKKTKMESNGQLSSILDDLGECGFVRKYCHPNRNVKDAIYQLIDCYSLFYYQFQRNAMNADENYWLKTIGTPRYNAWCGLSFEKICLLHSRQIKAALGISGIMSNIFSWFIRSDENHPGVQIDLLIDRSDNVVDICEMKYASGKYLLDARTLDNIKTKAAVLSQYLPKRKYVEPVLITSFGVAKNKYSEEILRQITSDQLFL